MLLAALSASASAAPAAKPSRVSFDGSLTTGAGQAPTLAEGVTFAKGRTGQAAVFGAQAKLDYPTQGIYQPKHGTIEMWVQRNWQATKQPLDRILWLIQDDAGKQNKTYLGFRGSSDSGRIYFGNAGGVDAATASIHWTRGAWHHLLACWDEALGVRALYIDGEFKAAAVYSRPMPTRQKVFHIGYSPNTGRGALAAIDDLHIYTTVAPADFLKQTGNTAAQRKARDKRKALVKRLGDAYSIDRVEKERIEVKWDDLVGLPTPFTQRVPIQPRLHPEVVFVHPDLAISLGRKKESLALGFGLGDEPELPDMHKVTRRLHNGYQPIVESQWKAGPLTLEQTAFGILPTADAVRKGTETEYVVVRMHVANTSRRAVARPLVVLVGTAGKSQCTNYRPYTAPRSRWTGTDATLKAHGDSLVAGDRVLLTWRCSTATPATFRPTLPGKSGFRNVLRFDLKLAAGESRAIDLVVAGTSALYPLAHRTRMAATDYEKALRRAEAHWEQALAPAMTLSTPDPKINEIYKTLVLSCLQNISNNPDRPWHEPYQSTFLAAVWPWEFAQMATPLAAIGYHKELEPSFRFFTMRQAGVGEHPVKRGPEGKVESIRGCYLGSSIFWMCETGAVLQAMAAKSLYSGDGAWLKANRRSVLAAWSFIQAARKQMLKKNPDGTKPIGYGLLPPGRATDAGGVFHKIGFSDNYTWEGMHWMARAFRAAGLPEADRLTREVAEYRECILEAIRRSQYVDADTGQLIIPNTLSRQSSGKLMEIRYSLAMWQTGLLDARDKRFDAAMEWQRRKGGFFLGFAFPYPIGSTFWYVNSIEKGKYMNHLARGEVEKSLLTYYTNLIYSMSQDCYQTVERLNVDEPNYSPFQPNASGNGRIIEMTRRMLIDEQEPGVLWLLRGCPRRWFAKGQAIAVANASTLYGTMAIRTQSDGQRVTIDIEAPSRRPVKEIRLVVRAPRRRVLRSATVNGQPATVHGDTITLAAPKGRLRVVCRY